MYNNSFSGQCNVSLKNLRNISNILVHYIFIVRINNRWSKSLIVRQDYLLDHFENNKVGIEHKGIIIFYISFIEEKVEYSGQHFSKYLQDFTDFPQIEH